MAANLAVAIRNQNPDKEVALIDGNLLHGDLGVILNASDQKSIADILRNSQQSRSRSRHRHPDHAFLGRQVAGGAAGRAIGRADHRRANAQVLQHMTNMFDYIIVDTRPSFDEVTLTLLDHSDKILLLLTLELTAIKGAKQYLELGDLLGYDSERISLVINRATSAGRHSGR